MSTTTLVPIETYLKTSYRPDREYIDGEVQERNLGEYEHGRIQALLSALFLVNESAWGVRTITDWRTQVSATRFRVPDLVIIDTESPREAILTHAPLIAIEILSPEDTFSRMRQRVEDLQKFGTQHIWVIDPEERIGYICHTPLFREWEATRHFTVPERGIVVDLEQVFARL